MEIIALKELIETADNKYPIYIGFITAHSLLKIAGVPHFNNNTPHMDIAGNILIKPIKDWQRPPDMERINHIAKFYNTASGNNEFMPNPVLLSENAIFPSTIEISPIDGDIRNVYTISIPNSDNLEDNRKPLWILDGQHRINGLAKSDQRNNPIPVVLLLDNNKERVYSGPTVAKIFAQVTTNAKPLDKLHNEWLSFAFNIRDYDNRQNNHRAMKTVSLLCKESNLNGEVNDLQNKIQFNDIENVTINPPGFVYDCQTLRKLIANNYYEKSDELLPEDLYVQIGLAYKGMVRTVKEVNKSVFFGEGKTSQPPMKDGFIIGILNYLINHEPLQTSNDWEDLFKRFKFHTTNWDFGWTLDKSSSAESISRKIANNFFTYVFTKLRLPENCDQIEGFFKGNKAKIKLGLYEVNESGKAIGNPEIIEVAPGDEIGNVNHKIKLIKLISSTLNIGQIDFTDAKSPSIEPIKFKQIGSIPEYGKKLNSKGLMLMNGEHNNPLEISMKFYNYGGTSKAQISLTIKWR